MLFHTKRRRRFTDSSSTAAGFDAFAVDLQGYGRSSKPVVMDEPCNTSADDQAKYLIPNPLRAACAPRYPHPFGSFATDWDEIDTVVKFIRSLHGDRALKVNLVGWSRGGMRVIGYAALRPDKVEKVVVLAPTRFPPAASAPTYPINMTDRRDSFIDWDRQMDSRNCPQQVDPSIRQALWNSTIALDKLEAAGERQAFGALPRSPQQDGPPTFRAAFGCRRWSYEERSTSRHPSERHALSTTRSAARRRT